MEYALGPAFVWIECQLEDNAVSMCAAVRRAIKIASTVEDHSSPRICSIGAAGEAVQDALGPGVVCIGSQHKDSPLAIGATLSRCPIQVSCCVERQGGLGPAP